MLIKPVKSIFYQKDERILINFMSIIGKEKENISLEEFYRHF